MRGISRGIRAVLLRKRDWCIPGIRKRKMCSHPLDRQKTKFDVVA
jgi:hypothetical protein